MAYEYNPLLKDCLQKKQNAATPEDVEQLQSEIDALTADVANKVTKFFASIDELEINEIGEYQGETNETFTNGYFYKRTNALPVEYEDVTIPVGSKKIIYTNLFDSTQKIVYAISTQTLPSIITTQYSQKGKVWQIDETVHNNIIYTANTSWLSNTPRVIPEQSGLFYSIDDALYDIYENNYEDSTITGVRAFFEYLQTVALTSGFRLDFSSPGIIGRISDLLFVIRIPIVYEYTGGQRQTDTNVRLALASDLENFNWNVDEYIAQFYEIGVVNKWCYDNSRSVEFTSFYTVISVNGTKYILDNTGGSGQGASEIYRTISADGEYERYIDMHHLICVFDSKPINTSSYWAQAIDLGIYFDYEAEIEDTTQEITIHRRIITYDEYGFPVVDIPAILRVDTQPSLNPDNFATATQGAKADTALQSISKGTDGNYINTTVTAKDANNQQTVGASLTIQDITSADNDHRGLLEALNTRNYIDTQIYKVSLNFFFYGVQWDENDPSPDCTRIGNMSLHAELPIQNAIIGGLLQDDLTFTPFADQSDWSGETVDGSAGQLMLQIPKHYFKSEINGTIHKKLISQYPLAGFIEIPLMYISAQKATVDRTDPNTPKLCSVVNTTAAFRGGNNTADWDGTYRSLLGFPASNISLTNFRQFARNRAAGTAWNCATYHAQRALYWLFVTEYATLNSQKPYNAAKDANGYAQGGLGPGVSNWNGNAWQAYNNYNPLIPCGYMLEFGNRSAIKNFSVKDANDNILVTFEVNSYRGIQSPFADIWDWMDGILINVQSNAAGGVSTCYVTDDPAKFSSIGFSQYRKVGVVPRAENWIKTIYDGETGDIICKSIPGSSTSYYCDWFWGLSLPASGVSLRGVLFGGSANRGALCGFLSALSDSVPGSVYPFIGSRLCAFPSP